jgi:cysteine synthase
MMSTRWDFPHYAELGIGSTSTLPLPAEAVGGAVLLKLEEDNPTGSIKDRTAYFLIRELWDRGELSQGDCLVESTSGNLGISLAFLGGLLGLHVCCVVDKTIAPRKLERLLAAGAEVRSIEDDQALDPRSRRIALAKQIGDQVGRHWVNQYGNEAGMRAHESTTGVELLQHGGQNDEVVVAVGTGGTICGIGRAFRTAGQPCRIVGVEPAGSTIFGGQVAPHHGYGAGYAGRSALFSRFGHIVDQGMKVSEADAEGEVRRLKDLAGLSVGMTTGMCLAYARGALAQDGRKRILCVAADSGEDYEHLTAAETGNPTWPAT